LFDGNYKIITFIITASLIVLSTVPNRFLVAKTVPIPGKNHLGFKILPDFSLYFTVTEVYFFGWAIRPYGQFGLALRRRTNSG